MILFLEISQGRMIDHYLPKLVRALESLNKDQLWLKESENLNSIGGIALHIGEHVNRHIVRLSKSDAVFNNGIEDHFLDMDQESVEVILTLRTRFNKWNEKLTERLENQNENELSSELDMHSIYHLVEHTGYHLGQIVDRTQRITAQSFQFCQNGINEKSLLDDKRDSTR
jgi:uncharacterized damage-inducible protein DinB